MMYFWLLIALVCGLDQMVKCFIKNNIVEFSQTPTFIPFLKITNIKNFGAALGMFGGVRWFLVAITAMFMFYFIYLIFIKKNKNKVFLLASAFILGGGISNLIDRAFYGYVIDYLSVSFFPPVCNLADYFITIGIIIFGIYTLVKEKESKKSSLN